MTSLLKSDTDTSQDTPHYITERNPISPHDLILWRYHQGEKRAIQIVRSLDHGEKVAEQDAELLRAQDRLRATFPDFVPPIAGEADLERESRLEAERVTWEFKHKSMRRIDSGKKPMDESPLFGGPKQGGLF